MTKGPADFFKVFENPITYVIRGEYNLDTQFNIIQSRIYRPHNEHTLNTKFKTDVLEATDSPRIRSDEFEYFQQNQGKILPFIVLQPLICYRKKDVPLEALRNDSIFPEHEKPIDIEKPVHPSELPTSMKGTKFYEVFSLTKYEKRARAYLTSGMDLSQWYLKDIDSCNGTRSVPDSLFVSIPLDDIVEIEEMLKKEEMDGDLTDRSKIIGRAVILFNHKDFGMSHFLQLPEKS